MSPRERGVGTLASSRGILSIRDIFYGEGCVCEAYAPLERGVGLRKAGPQGLRALGSVRSVPT